MELKVAIYARVSTEDQAERQTIQAQLDFLRNFCALYNIIVAGEYTDEGWSGSIPLSDRPDGRRLLEDAKAGRFTAVLVYRLDRLGRSLSSLIQAHDSLEKCEVTIRSATEPFDTSSPIGRFVFQLLGSIAELEKSTIVERMGLGMDRISKTGKWNRGPIPFGYEVDKDGFLTPSTRMIPALNMTEAEVVRLMFASIASGSTTLSETLKLNAADVPRIRRYANGKLSQVTERWGPSTVLWMLRSTVYKGVHTIKSARGAIIRSVTPLVSEELWERTQRQLNANNLIGSKNSERIFLLRGLLKCDCGRYFAGNGDYYRCTSTLKRVLPNQDRTTCEAKALPVEWTEEKIWNDIRYWASHPNEYLVNAQEQLRERLEKSAGVDEQRRALLLQIGEKEGERERVMTLYRRNRITLEEAERQMDDIDAEMNSLRRMVEAIRSQSELTDAFEKHLATTATMLHELNRRLDEIELRNDRAEMREYVRAFVHRINVHTSGEGRKKAAELEILYAYKEPSVTPISVRPTTDICYIPLVRLLRVV